MSGARPKERKETRIFCKHCNIFVYNNQLSLSQHEKDEKHQRNLKKFMETVKKNSQQKLKATNAASTSTKPFAIQKQPHSGDLVYTSHGGKRRQEDANEIIGLAESGGVGVDTFQNDQISKMLASVQEKGDSMLAISGKWTAVVKPDDEANNETSADILDSSQLPQSNSSNIRRKEYINVNEDSNVSVSEQVKNSDNVSNTEAERTIPSTSSMFKKRKIGPKNLKSK
jgi:hypothetical protein